MKDISLMLIEAQKNMQNAILEGNIEDFCINIFSDDVGDWFNDFEHMIQQMIKFQMLNGKMTILGIHLIYEILKKPLSPEMGHAILTFYASGDILYIYW